MAETDFKVYRLDGQVHLVMTDDSDDAEIITLDPTNAWVLGNALVEKALQQEDDPSD